VSCTSVHFLSLKSVCEFVADVDYFVKDEGDDPQASQCRPHTPHNHRGIHQQHTQRHLSRETK
jgi:hypothetical protein